MDSKSNDEKVTVLPAREARSRNNRRMTTTPRVNDTTTTRLGINFRDSADEGACDDRRASTNECDGRTMSVCKQEVGQRAAARARSRAACSQLFIEADYCATNVAVYVTRAAALLPWALSVTRLYTKERAFLRAFLPLCSTILVLECEKKNEREREGQDKKKDPHRPSERKDARKKKKEKQNTSAVPIFTSPGSFFTMIMALNAVQ